MNKRTIGFVLVALGVVMAVVSLLADVIGLGTDWGINWAQLTGAGVGVVVALVGAWLALRKAEQKK